MINASRIKYLTLSDNAKKLLVALVEEGNTHYQTHHHRVGQTGRGDARLFDGIAFCQLDLNAAFIKARLLVLDTISALKELVEEGFVNDSSPELAHIDPDFLRAEIAQAWHLDLMKRQLKKLSDQQWKRDFNKSLSTAQLRQSA